MIRLLKNNKQGFTLIESLFSLAIFMVLVPSLFFIREAGRSGSDFFVALIRTEERVNSSIKTMVGRLRRARYSDDGGFPIEEASASSIVFFSDIDGDLSSERLRYFFEGGSLKIGITPFDEGGSQYDYLNDETVTTVFSDIDQVGSRFVFYGAGFDGSSGGVELVAPIDLQEIVLIGVEVEALISSSRFDSLVKFSGWSAPRALRN